MIVRSSSDDLIVRFHAAMGSRDPVALRAVLDDGLDPNTFERKIHVNHGETLQHLLMPAMSSTSAPCLQVMLEAGANPRLAHQENRESVLSRAISRSRLDMAVLLIEAGDDVNAVCADNWRPAHAAASAGSVPILDLLERHWRQAFGLTLA